MSSTLEVLEHKLDNGLKILFKNVPGVHSATFMVWYKVGARNETVGKTGLSHFLEHLSFKRTEMFKKGQIISEIIRNGGIFNAYTSRDFTCYYESFATNKLELAAIIESQRMNNLILNEHDKEVEKGIILSELEKNLDNPYNVLENELRQQAYPHHPYRIPIIGYKDDVKDISLYDLQRHYDNFYSPNNAIIVVVGDFDSKQMFEIINKYFSNIKSTNLNGQIKTEKKQKELKRLKIKEYSSSPIVKLAYHIPNVEHEDIFSLVVLGELLNCGVSSRLYQDFVEQQIVTDINTNVELAKDTGLFSIIATLFPNIKHKDYENKIFEEIDNMVTVAPLSQEELNKIKKRIKSSFEFNKDGTFKQAYLLGYYESIYNHKFLETYTDKIQEVSIDDVKNVIKKYINRNNCTIGHLIPVHQQKKSLFNYDYVPKETTKEEYNDIPIIIPNKLKKLPVSFYKETLNNGIKIIINENKTGNIVRLYGTIGAGNIFASSVNPVLPVLTAGMLNRGSISKSKIEIASEIEEKGATVGISNVGEMVNFSLSSTVEDFESVLKILKVILREPAFEEKEFYKYKKFALANVSHKMDDSKYLANMKFSQMLYPKDHLYYIYSLKAQEEQILNIELDDLKNFYNNYYSPHTIIMSVSGNIDREKARILIENEFNDWPARNVPHPYIKPANIQNKYTEKMLHLKNKSEAEVIMGHYCGIARKSKDFHKATVMNFILGGSGALSSRIGKKLREELGLVYSISSSLTALSVPGSLTIRFGVDNHYLNTAIKTLKEELNSFIEFGIDEAELDAAKSYLTGSYPLKFSNNAGIAKILLTNEYYGLGDNYLNEYLEIIDSITVEDINETIKKYIHPELFSVVMAGCF